MALVAIASIKSYVSTVPSSTLALYWHRGGATKRACHVTSATWGARSFIIGSECCSGLVRAKNEIITCPLEYFN